MSVSSGIDCSHSGLTACNLISICIFVLEVRKGTWRTSAKLCVRRLYSSAHFNDTFPAHTPPEILNTSLEGLTLLMKAMHVDKVNLSTLFLLALSILPLTLASVPTVSC